MMKARILLVTVLIGYQSSGFAQESDPLATHLQKFSYGIGLQIGQQLKRQGMQDLDAKAIGLAVEDVVSGRNPRVSIDEMRLAAIAYQADMEAKMQAQAEVNQAAGEKFLEENSTRDGVVALDSGLQYRIVAKGTGETPTETDTVIVHYRGRLLDGTEFDSSFGRDEPTELMVAQVIPGWQQALQRMPVGSNWEVWVPSNLGYGVQGVGDIGPNETLHFEIQLIEIKQDL